MTFCLQRRRNQTHHYDGDDLERELAPLGLRVKTIEADGNCFFRSVSDQLEVRCLVFHRGGSPTVRAGKLKGVLLHCGSWLAEQGGPLRQVWR